MGRENLFTRRSKEVIRALDEAGAKYQGKLTPELLIKEARPQDSPLHTEFVWDNNRAGHLYRLSQARRILRTYAFRRVPGSHEPVEARKYYLLAVRDGERKQYVSAAEVFKDQELLRLAAIEAYNQFRTSLRMLAPFPQYFGELLETIDRECAKINLAQRGSAAAAQ